MPVVHGEFTRAAAHRCLVHGRERRAALDEPGPGVGLEGLVARDALAGHVEARHVQVQRAEGVGQVVAVVVGETGVTQGHHLLERVPCVFKGTVSRDGFGK
jgi:hypothetical protein